MSAVSDHAGALDHAISPLMRFFNTTTIVSNTESHSCCVEEVIDAQGHLEWDKRKFVLKDHK